MKKQHISKITTFALVMLIVGSIDSIRNLPATALFGSSLIFFFVLSAIMFLIPVGLVSAQLASTSSLPAGIYGWVKSAFGKKTAVFAIWLQWINTMVWYPTILSFIAATASFVIDPQLAQNKIYLVSIIIGVFWFLTILNLKGVKTSARFASICTIVGMVIPMAFIFVLAAIWVFGGHPLQIHLSLHSLVPTLSHGQSWISLTAIMTAFLGMELAAVHVKDVNNPQQSYPKGLLISVIFILFTMIVGSLAIAFVLPQNQINLVDGVMQVFVSFFANYHLTWLVPVLTVMLVVGALGGMVNWVISPAKGLLQAAEDGFLPEFLSKTNQHGVAKNLLLLQAILVTISCLAFVLMPSVNGSYWLLTALSTQLYMFMYALMFIAMLKLKPKFKALNPAFTIPGGKFGLMLTCLLGLVGCTVTVIVGFFPPDGINVGGFWHYEMIFSLGIFILLMPALGLYAFKANKKKQAERAFLQDNIETASY